MVSNTLQGLISHLRCTDTQTEHISRINAQVKKIWGKIVECVGGVKFDLFLIIREREERGEFD